MIYRYHPPPLNIIKRHAVYIHNHRQTHEPPQHGQHLTTVAPTLTVLSAVIIVLDLLRTGGGSWRMDAVTVQE